MLHPLIRNTLALTCILGASHADIVPVYNNWINSSFAGSKNAITAGATTATAKGYNAILSNPAGLSTNYNVALYAKTVTVERKDNDGNAITKYDNMGTNLSIGILYDSFAIETRLNDYVVFGGAYGYESSYGLFSIGASYLMDQTDITDNGDISNKEFATGDYSTVGLMWQKSFIDEDDFYALYFGLSTKSYGNYSGTTQPGVNLKYSSPKRTSYGLGFETNVFTTSVLVTYDISKEEGQGGVTLDGTSYGIKWLIAEKFALAGGISNQTFSDGELDTIETIGAGVEFGLWGLQSNLSATQRTINAKQVTNNLSENAIHLDVAFVY